MRISELCVEAKLVPYTFSCCGYPCVDNVHTEYDGLVPLSKACVSSWAFTVGVCQLEDVSQNLLSQIVVSLQLEWGLCFVHMNSGTKPHDSRE